jgi:putative ABC transport system permease protein
MMAKATPASAAAGAMVRPVLGALFSHWRRHPIQLATLLVGLAVATALWAGVQALNAEARASYDRAAAMVAGNTLAAAVAADGGRFALEDYVVLRRAGWAVSPLLEGSLRTSEGSLRVIGIDPVSLPPAAESLTIGEGTDRLLEFITPPNLVLAAPETLPLLEGVPDLPEVVADPGLPPETLLVDMGLAERLLGAPGWVSRLLLAPDETRRALPEALAERLRIVEPGAEDDLGRLTDSFHLNLTAFGFLSFVVGLFIVYAAIGLAFEERRSMLRTLRALGVSARQLTVMLGLELVALALVAGALGMALGYVIAASLLPDVAASLRGLYGARVPGTLQLSAEWWVAGLGISLAGALAAAAASLARAWRLPVLAPAQPQAWLAASRRSARRQLGLGVGLLAVAAGALVAGEGLVSGFVVIGSLLLGAALLLPVALQAALAFGAGRARGPVAQWIWADGRQQLGGLSLALMALLLALAVNVGVGTMVESFRRTFLGYLDQRLAAEVYVTLPDGARAAEVAGWLADRPEVRAVLPIWRADGRVGDWPAEIVSFRDDATYREAWPLLAALPDAWDRVAAGQAVLVSEQTARRFALAPGDRTELPTPAGPWPVEIAAVYADYGNPEGQVMASVAALEARWEDIRRTQLAARVAPEAAPGLLAALRERFGLDETEAVDQAAVKALSEQVFERTFAVTVALNALTLAVAGIALFTSLLALAGQRRLQVAPLWAVGLRRRTLAGLELGRALALAGATALLALPLGLALAWVLTAVINVRAFGWRLPVHLFPGDWLGLLATALLTAGLAALVPVLRLARARPADLLRGFSNER